MPEREHGGTDRAWPRQEGVEASGRGGMRPPERASARACAPSLKPALLQGVRKEQRREGERQLKGQPDEEGRLEHEVGRNAARSRSGARGAPGPRSRPGARARRGAAAGATAGGRGARPRRRAAAGEHERQPPDEERRRVAEVRVAALRMEPHVVLAGGRDEPIGEAVCAKPGRHCQRQRDHPRGPPSPHNAHIIPPPAYHYPKDGSADLLLAHRAAFLV